MPSAGRKIQEFDVACDWYTIHFCATATDDMKYGSTNSSGNTSRLSSPHAQNEAISRSAVALVYLLYLGMLAWLAWHRMGQLWPALVVPASAFVVGTLVRKLIDRPRPYTALGFTPLFPKDKTGQSMPSRHCFSAAAMAGTAWYVLPPLGAVLAVLGVLIAISRVVTGVHYISDVLAGLAFGSVFAVLGWNAFVLAASALGFYAIMLL